MSGSLFGLLSAFDHNDQTWDSYKSRISQWFIANDIDHKSDSIGIKRRAILLSALSDGTYKLAADLALPKPLQEVPYEEILTLLDQHFTPKRCGFSERYNFYSAIQQPTETNGEWAARLRGLTAHCHFSNIEEALRDRFVMGMVSGPEKDKLFAQDIKNLTLVMAVKLAESVKSARIGAAAAHSATAQLMPTPTVTPREREIFKIRADAASTGAISANEKVQCQVCGYRNHNSSQCRFKKYKCKKCKVTGHLSKMCKKINFIESSVVDEGDDDGKCFNIRSKCGEPMTEIVTLAGIKLKFEIDSGSAVTAISELTYKKHFSDVPLSLTKKRLMSYNGDNIICLGVAELPVNYAGTTHSLCVYIVRDGGPPILGRDFISRFRLELLPVRYCKQINNNNIIKQLQSRYPAVFSGKLGLFNKYKVCLRLKDNVNPVFIRARPIAFALRHKVDAEIDRLISLGVLKPIEHSLYASPIVPVLKRNGSVRICADYSTGVNKQLLIEQYPLPTVTELFAKLCGGQQFSKLDLSNAYNQFLLDDPSQNITCINTHRGLFKYTRMVFGLSSAPAVFQRAMENVLAGLPGTLCLLDDVLVTGKSHQEHLERLNTVLQRLQDAGLTLQNEKCEFFKDEINYLGYVINKNGLKKSPQKVKAIVEAPRPTDINKLQSFLGLVNYYRTFVPAASTILSPLYELLKKGTKWSWSSEHDRAFLKIKQCLASEQTLAHFNPDAHIILTVDASPCGLGAILSQIEPGGCERPLSFASRTLNAAEKKYSQIQKEATAIVFGVRRYHQYLYGRAVPFTLRTDHKPLLSIFGPYRGIPEVSANRLQRYAMFLSGYNYNIEYIRSANNSADFLSRASLPDCGGEQDSEEARCADATAAILDRASYINFVIEGSLPVTLDELREHTRTDETIGQVIKFVMNGWPKKVSDERLKPYHSCRLQLSFENGCLMRGHKVVIPEKLQKTVMSELHHSHLGIVKTKAEARSKFWFPGVDAAVERLIGSCNVCMQLRPTPPRAPLAPWKHPPQPFYRIHVDFLGPIDNHMYLVVVDAYSKWVEVYDMRNSISSTATITKMLDFFSRFGLPHTLVSDNGTSFTSREFDNFLKLNGIKHATSPAYHPASNGQAESYVKVVKKGIKSSLLDNRGVQDSYNKLLKYLFDYRNSVHTTTGFPPAELVYGRKLRTRLDLINPNPPPLSSTTLANVVNNKQCSQSKSYGGYNNQTFIQGDQILYKKFTNNGKFKWCRGVIEKKLGKVMYLIKDIITTECLSKHKNQIVKFKGTDSAVPPSNIDIDIQNRSFSPEFLPSAEEMENNESEDREITLELATSRPVGETTATHQEAAKDYFDALSDPPAETAAPSTSRSRRDLPRVDYKPFL